MLSERNVVCCPRKVSNPILAHSRVVSQVRVQRFARIALVIALTLGWAHDPLGNIRSANASEKPDGSVPASGITNPAVDAPETTAGDANRVRDPANESSAAADTAQPGSEESTNGSNEGENRVSEDAAAQFEALLTRIRHPTGRELDDAVRNCDAILALCRTNRALADRLSEEDRKLISDLYAWVAGLMMQGKYAPKPDDASEIGEIYNAEILRLLGCAIEVQPSYWKHHFVRARVRERFGDMGGALRDLDVAEQCDGPVERVCYARGLLQSELFMLTDAIRELDRACAADQENDFRLWVVRAEVHLLLGDSKRALGDLERATEVLRHQDDHCMKIRTAFHRAEAYRLLGRMQEFEIAHEEAKEMFRRSTDRRVTILRLVMKEAISRDDPTEGRTNRIIREGDAYFDLGMFDECLAKYDQLSPTERQSICDVQRRLGVIHLIRGQPEEAVECFGRAIELAEEDIARNYFGRSEAWHRVGDIPKATADYRQGRRLLFDVEPPKVTPFTGPYFLAYLQRHGGKAEERDERPE